MKKYQYLIFVITSFIILMNSCKKKEDAGIDSMEVQLQNGLIGWYPFKGDATDKSGNNNHGTVVGATLTTDRFGNPNSAYDFVVSNFITTPIIQKNITAWSVSLWFKTTLGGGLIRGSRDCNGGYGTRLDMRGDSEYKLTYAADDYRYVEGASVTNSYNDGVWHHIAGVWNGIGKTLVDKDQFAIYIDGTLAPQIKYSTVNPPPPYPGEGFHHSIPMSGTTACVFGAGLGCPTGGDYAGQLDDIRIYNRVLTTEEITYLATH